MFPRIVNLPGSSKRLPLIGHGLKDPNLKRLFVSFVTAIYRRSPDSFVNVASAERRKRAMAWCSTRNESSSQRNAGGQWIRIHGQEPYHVELVVGQKEAKQARREHSSNQGANVHGIVRERTRSLLHSRAIRVYRYLYIITWRIIATPIHTYIHVTL